VRTRNLAAIVAGVSILGYALRDNLLQGLHDISHLHYTPPPLHELVRNDIKPLDSYRHVHVSNVRSGDIVLPMTRLFLIEHYNSHMNYGFNPGPAAPGGTAVADGSDLILIKEYLDQNFYDGDKLPPREPTAVIFRRDGMTYMFLNLENPNDKSKLTLYSHTREWRDQNIGDVLESIATEKNKIMEKLLAADKDQEQVTK